MKVPLAKPSIGELEIASVLEVLRSGTLSLGPRLQEFEERFAAYVGTRFAVAGNSGTSALHLCVRALDIGPQDEIITTSFTFIASSNCALFEGALPRFVDIDPITMNVSPFAIEEFLQSCCVRSPYNGSLIDRGTGRSVKAILPVHVFGLPCEMDAIGELARKYRLRVLEDACEAIGAQFRGRHVGTFGDAGVFAFYPNKQITTGEGGMIVTNDERIAQLCRSMRNQGRDTGSPWLEHARLGYNYRLSDLHCALGIAQLGRIDEILAARGKVAAWYQSLLANIPVLDLPITPRHMVRSWLGYIVRFNGYSPSQLRGDVMAFLRERGIDSRVYFPAVHRQPLYKRLTGLPDIPLPVTESASERCLALPFFTEATPKQVHYVCDSLLEALDEAGVGIANVRLPAEEISRGIT